MPAAHRNLLTYSAIVEGWCALLALTVFAGVLPLMRVLGGSWTWSVVASGAWMLLVWYALYRRPSFSRLVVAPLTLALLGCGIHWTRSLVFDRHYYDYFRFGSVIFTGSLMWILPLVLARQVFGWTIVHSSNARSSSASQFSLRWLFLLTTAIALATAMASAVSVDRVIVQLVVVNSVIGLILLSAMSRLSVPGVWIFALLLAFIAGLAHAIPVCNRVNWRIYYQWEMVFAAFLRHWSGYSLAAGVVLLASGYLRSQGFVLLTGGSKGFAEADGAGATQWLCPPLTSLLAKLLGQRRDGTSVDCISSEDSAQTDSARWTRRPFRALVAAGLLIWIVMNTVSTSRQAKQIAAIESLGGVVTYDYQHRYGWSQNPDVTSYNASAESRVPRFLWPVFGRGRVLSLHFHKPTLGDAELEDLGRFAAHMPHVQLLSFNGTLIGDRTLAMATAFPELRKLHLDFTRVSSRGVAGALESSHLGAEDVRVQQVFAIHKPKGTELRRYRPVDAAVYGLPDFSFVKHNRDWRPFSELGVDDAGLCVVANFDVSGLLRDERPIQILEAVVNGPIDIASLENTATNWRDVTVAIHMVSDSNAELHIESKIRRNDSKTLSGKIAMEITASTTAETTLRAEVIGGLPGSEAATLRRVLTQRGYEVLALRSIAVGPVKLSDLPVGESRRLTAEECVKLAPALEAVIH